MITICKSWTFDAAHQLDTLPATHKCSRMHGHTYRVELTIAGPLDDQGMVIDYDTLDAIVAPIIDRVDHRILNDALAIPTTERLVLWFRDHILLGILRPLLRAVRVYESSTTWAEWRAA